MCQCLMVCSLSSFILFLFLTSYQEHTRGYRTRTLPSEQTHPRSSFSSVSSSNINFQNEIHQWSTSHQSHELNRYHSPTASRPILNRVHDPHSSFSSSSSSAHSDTFPIEQKRALTTTTTVPSASRSNGNKTKGRLKESAAVVAATAASDSYRAPVVPSPSVFLSSKISKDLKKKIKKEEREREEEKEEGLGEMLLVLPVEYSIPSLLLSTSSLPMTQHGVVVLQSTISLQELVTQLKDQFDLTQDFDLILSQRKKNGNHREIQPAVVQVHSVSVSIPPCLSPSHTLSVSLPPHTLSPSPCLSLTPTSFSASSSHTDVPTCLSNINLIIKPFFPFTFSH
jgi:hypothetical protein